MIFKKPNKVRKRKQKEVWSRALVSVIELIQRNEFIVHRFACTVATLNTVVVLAPDNWVSAVFEGPQILGFASFVYRTYTNAYLQRSIQICNVIEY